MNMAAVALLFRCDRADPRKVAGLLRDLATSLSERVVATAITNGDDANDGTEGRNMRMRDG